MSKPKTPEDQWFIDEQKKMDKEMNRIIMKQAESLWERYKKNNVKSQCIKHLTYILRRDRIRVLTYYHPLTHGKQD